MKKTILSLSIIGIILAIFLACSEEREHASPFDPEYWESDIPSLTDLTLENTAIDTIKLTWINNAQLPERFSYRIDKKIGDGIWIENYKIIASNTLELKDFAEINKVISYRAFIIYDKNISNKFERSKDNIFTAPTNLTVTQTSLTSAILTWSDNSIGEEKFEIERKLSTESAYTKIAEVSGSNTATKSWIDTATIPNLNYDYKVAAAKGTDKSVSISNQFINSFQAPTGLTAAQNNVSTFTLSWTDNSTGEDGFKIERKIDDGTYAVIATVTGTSYVDNTVSKGFGTVYYQVQAYKGTTYNSTYATANSTVSFPAPTNLNVTQTSITSANLTWTDNSIGEEKFEIERKLSTESTYVKVSEVTGSETATKNWNDTTVEPDKTYDYRIRGVKGVNSTAYTITTGYTNAFPAPNNLEYSKINIYTIQLNWLENSKGEDGFIIDKKTGTGDWIAGFAIVSENSISWTDINAAINQTIEYRVYAFKGEFSTSSISTSVIDNTFPAPTNLSVTQSSVINATLAWADNSIGEDKFEIERKLSTESTYLKIAEVIGSDITIKNWNDTTVEPDKTYDYRVRGVKGANSSSYAVKTGYTNAFPAPTNLVYAKINIYTIELNWIENSRGEDGFIIDKKINTENWITSYATVAENINSWTDNNADVNQVLEYRVYAYKGDFETSSINTSEIDNTFPAPSNISSVVDSETSITLSWTDNSNGEDEFKIDRKTGTGGTWVIDYATVNQNTSVLADTDLITGTTYYYRIRAKYQTFHSNYTNEVNVTPHPSLCMIYIPIGSFSMGIEGGLTNPIHTVNITRPYYLSKYETTQIEWMTIMESSGASQSKDGDYLPMTYSFSWYSILKYCNLRSLAEGLTPCYSISGSTDPSVWGPVPTSASTAWNSAVCNFNVNGYRLPTEAEWEYAARYNDGRSYPWGNTLPDSSLCNYNSNVGTPTVVGSYSSGNSSLGLCDMAGNAQEWVWDKFEIYPTTTQTDPSGPSSTLYNYRVIRGGNWGSGANDINSADRYSYYPDYITNCGFRLARTFITK
jgi:formylglycine-generating enzyme required for sulfatase activity